MLDVFEKIVWVLTGLVIVGVVGLAVLGPRSTVSEDSWKWDFERLNASRLRPAGSVEGLGARARQLARAGSRPGAARSGGARAAGRSNRDAGTGGSDVSPYADPGAVAAPAAVLQRGGRYVGGVYHAPPVYIPSSMRTKYSTFQDLVDLGQTAASKAVEIDGQDAVELTWVDERSPIATHLGLQPGDVIVSVNGRPASRSQARQLFEELKNETDFEVLILRNGQRMTLHYSVR